MSAALSAARALTTGTLIAASAATIGIGVHLANDHTLALASAQTYQAPTQTSQAPAGSQTLGSGDDSGGGLGQLFQGSTGSSGQGAAVSPGVTGGAQTRTSGS